MKLHCLLIWSLSFLFFNLFGCLVNRHVVQVELAAVSPLLKQRTCTCFPFVETVKDAVSTIPKLFFSNSYDWICGNPASSMF